MSKIFFVLIIVILILAFVLLAADCLNLADVGSMACGVKGAVGIIKDDEI